MLNGKTELAKNGAVVSVPLTAIKNQNTGPDVLKSSTTDLHDFKPFQDNQESPDLARLKLKEDRNLNDIDAYLIDKFVRKDTKNYNKKKTDIRLYVKENLEIVDEKFQFFDCDDVDEESGEDFDEPQ